MAKTMRPDGPITGSNAATRRNPVTLIGPGEVGSQWLVTGHDMYKQFASDPRFSADHFRPGYPSVFPVRRRATADGQKVWRTYSGMDAPDHAAHRRLIAPEFAARRIAELRPWVQRVVHDRLDRLFKGHETADLEQEFAAMVAAEVISKLLGVPEDRINAWAHYSDILVGDGMDRASVAAASAGFRAELAAFIADKDATPGADLTSSLIATYRRESSYAPEQVLEFVGAIFLAGLKSTASMIAVGALTLLEASVAARLIASGEPGAIARVVDELLRFHSIADRVTARVAVEPVEIAGRTICPGDGIVVSSFAANRDPTVFADPDTFDVGRARRRHVAFGYGPHRCLGEHLARLEIEIALSALFCRFPDLALADGYPRPSIDTSAVFRRLTAPLMVSSPPSER